MAALKQLYSKHLSRESSSERNMKIPLRQEEMQTLYSDTKNTGSTSNTEIILKIDDNGDISNSGRGGAAASEATAIWRDSSYDFRADAADADTKRLEKTDSGRSFDFQATGEPAPADDDPADSEPDPTTKLIGGFLERQRRSGQMSLDMDLGMAELGGLATVPEHSPPGPASPPSASASASVPGTARSPSASPKDFRVSFEPSPRVQIGEPVFQSSRRDSGGAEDPVEILKCSGRASPAMNFNRSKTRSRLIDPPQPVQGPIDGHVESGYLSRRRSGQNRSGQFRSGVIGMNNTGGGLERLDEEEEDPFEDIPTEFKRVKCDFWFVLQIACTLVSAAAVVCSVTISWLSRRSLWGLHLWKWCSLALAVCCGRLISGFLIRILVFLIECNFMLRKRVLYFVYGLKKAVQNCLWLVIVLIAWHNLFDKKVRRETRSKTLQFVNKALVCLVVGTFIWLLKTLLLKVLAMRFHVSTYFDRIQEALFNQYVLETLSGPPGMEIERIQKEEEKLIKEVAELREAGATVPPDLRKSGLLSATPRSGAGGKSGRVGKSGRSFGKKDDCSKEQQDCITIDQLHKLNQKNVSAWNMKRLINIVRHGVLSTLDESFQNMAGEDESATQIRSEWEAKVAAKKVFKNVAKRGAKYIGPDDLMRFLPEKQAVRAMSLFEGAQESNRVTKSALKNWAVNVYRERKSLALTLNDTKTAVKTLHQMVNVVVAVVIIIISLLILGIATTHILVVISSQVLLVVFMFGNTCKTVFESIIFLFVMHPFDVGDRCSIEGVQMVVEEMNILTTVFLRYDNEKIYFPNSVLATKPISNFYRSPDMGDAIDFCIHISTPMEKLSILREKLKICIESKPEHWYQNPMIVLREVEDMNRIKMSVWLQHKINHQDMGEKWLRRSLLMEEMVKIFKELDIEYRLLPMDVNVRTFANLATSSTRLPTAWMNHLNL